MGMFVRKSGCVVHLCAEALINVSAIHCTRAVDLLEKLVNVSGKISVLLLGRLLENAALVSTNIFVSRFGML